MSVKPAKLVGEKTVQKTVASNLEGPVVAAPWTPSLMGKKGGASGGYAAAKKLTKRQRKARGKHAITVRWKNKKTAST